MIQGLPRTWRSHLGTGWIPSQQGSLLCCSTRLDDGDLQESQKIPELGGSSEVSGGPWAPLAELPLLCMEDSPCRPHSWWQQFLAGLRKPEEPLPVGSTTEWLPVSALRATVKQRDQKGPAQKEPTSFAQRLPSSLSQLVHFKQSSYRN